MVTAPLFLLQSDHQTSLLSQSVFLDLLSTRILQEKQLKMQISQVLRL